MPELPEVETVRRGLVSLALNRTISKVQVLHPRSIRRHVEGKRAFSLSLSGQEIREVRRRGKYLWFEFKQSPAAMIAHLGLSGQFRPAEGATLLRHERLRIAFEDSYPALAFCDQRTFGGLYVDELDSASQLPRSLLHIAPDPFDPTYDIESVVDRIRRKDAPIKAVLLDQTVVSGVGNIYADESLWRSKVHPLTRAARLKRHRIHELLLHVNDVLNEALESGGTTFDGLYVAVNGESGDFSEQLAAYGRGGKPCMRCGAKLRREKFANRSSVRCPRCQPVPRSMAS